jgi:DNA mismatch repair protein MutL
VPKIQRLSAALANQIAAGEVVERPASVVKELVENALDAGATRIGVTVEYGGKRLIRVEDDGEGMEPEDARLALERHATSKIRTSDDLGAIATLGFRGEALPSIASVSHLTLRTRARGALSGTEITVHGGAVAAVVEVGAPEGTRVDVENLFFNLPARRKFLKSDQAEAAQVSRIVTQLAMGAHGVPGAALPDLRRPRRPAARAQGNRRDHGDRVHRAAGRDRSSARTSECLHQRAAGSRQDHRARHR